MKKLFLQLLFLLPLGIFAQPQQLSLQNFATGFTEPIYVCHAGDERIFVVEKRGVISILDQNGVRFPNHFLDIDPRVNSGASERGLLGLAFHPNYANNGYFYVNYTNSSGSTVISRFSVSANPDIADQNSEEILLTIPQPFSNHNGGCIQFGPDGYLYIGMGDGGSGGDPGNRAQNGMELLGKMLRIDVDNGLPYSIPPSNPYFPILSIADEIWAIGLRNPWRFSFDKVTGDMWIGDVGQNVWEEIDFWPGNDLNSGKNFGWRCYEGNAAYNTSGCNAQNTYAAPIFEFDHSQNNCSVTGGYVYRGARYGNLWGHYFHTDYCGGYLWYTKNNGPNIWNTQRTNNSFSSFNLVSFGEDYFGELYAVGISTGIIYKLADTTCTPHAYIMGGDSISVCIPGGSLTAIGGPSLSYQWLENGSPISGANSNEFTPSNAGNYSVIVSNGSCLDTSNVVYADLANAPVVTMSFPTREYCDFDAPILGTFNPSGGTLYGTGASGNFFDPATAGPGSYVLTYIYVDPQSGCSGQDTFSVNVSTCVSNNTAKLEQFDVVPNPNTGDFQLVLRLNSTEVCQIRVLDLAGKLIFSHKLSLEAKLHQLPIQLNHISDGVYFLDFEVGEQHFVRKLVVQKSF